MSSSAAVGNKHLQMFKYIYSTLLLIFCLVLILGVVFTGQTHLSHDVHPGLALVVLIISITWLTMVEGGQGAIVGLGPVNPELYEETHPFSAKCCKLVHKGDNLDRYLLGRQFMVILIVFCVEMAGAATVFDELWGLPSWLTSIFLSSGLAMILFTCMVGQLNSEVNGCHCMLDYINNWFAVITVWVAMAIEFSGLLHASYLVQHFVANLAGKPIESSEPPKSPVQNIFFYGRCLFSVGVLAFSFAVTMVALFDGKTGLWEAFPPEAAIVLFFVLLFIIGNLEGSQIAYFAVSKLQQSERGDSYFAKKTCEIIFKNNNHNLAAFMIGRQLCVVSCMFFIARITAVKLDDGDENIFGVSDGTQALFSTGLLGAHIVAIIGSISWRLIASAFPIPFLSNPITFILLNFCLFLEMTGLLHGAWVLAALHKKLAGFQRDEVYIGTAEERAAKLKRDDSKILHVGPGHIVPDVDVGDNPIDSMEEEAAKADVKDEDPDTMLEVHDEDFA